MFIGRTDVEAETPILWPPDVKNRLIRKDLDSGKDWGQEEKGTTEDEMAGWHHWLDGRESEWTPGVGDGPGGLACCDSWGCKELDMTERLNWTELTLVPSASSFNGSSLCERYNTFIDYLCKSTQMTAKIHVGNAVFFSKNFMLFYIHVTD